jgi:hypothetical protein
MFGWGGIGASVLQYGTPNWLGIGSNLKVYSHFFGNQYVKVMSVPKIAGGIGIGLTGLGIAIEGAQVFKGDMSFGNFAIDTSIGAIGVIGGPVGAIVAGGWFAADPLNNVNSSATNPAQAEQHMYVDGMQLVRCS